MRVQLENRDILFVRGSGVLGLVNALAESLALRVDLYDGPVAGSYIVLEAHRQTGSCLVGKIEGRQPPILLIARCIDGVRGGVIRQVRVVVEKIEHEWFRGHVIDSPDLEIKEEAYSVVKSLTETLFEVLLAPLEPA
ncbi:hypothetical protein HOI18_03755 [Candidatus Uhrbacteria bacterium]|jgi:hypothetical protein|nr:hypothetical protein [Candidatus Uhrbacteria bacterium]